MKTFGHSRLKKRAAALILSMAILAAAISGTNLLTLTAAAVDYSSLVGTVVADFSNQTYYSLTPPSYNTYYPWECTWYACGRAEEKAGGKISGIRSLHNANQWYAGAQSKGLSTGYEIRSNSIACYNSGTYGHVIYIENVTGSTVYYTEANTEAPLSDQQRSPSDGKIKTKTVSQLTSKAGYQGCIYLNIQENTDTTAPAVSGVRLESPNISSMGYVIVCNISDNVGVTSVKFPTWTESGGQDDIVWHNGNIEGNLAWCFIPADQHNRETGRYITDVYAYDAAGNYGFGTVSVDLTPGTVPASSTQTVKNGIYSLKNDAGFYMDVSNGADSNGNNVWEYGFNGSSAQQFYVEYQGGGKYYLYPQNSAAGRVLDIYRGPSYQDSLDQGDKADIWEKNDPEAQLFCLAPLGDGSFALELASRDNYVIGGAHNYSTSPLYLQRFIENSPSQRWYFCDKTSGAVIDSPVILPGDVNGDTLINAVDIMAIRKLLLTGGAAAEQISAGDLSGDGKLDPVDIMRLRKLLMR